MLSVTSYLLEKSFDLTYVMSKLQLPATKAMQIGAGAPELG